MDRESLPGHESMQPYDYGAIMLLALSPSDLLQDV
jgi:hypothetical protein